MITSTYGEGHTLQLGHGWDNIPDHSRARYPYLMDYIFNQVFFIADLPFPEDLPLVHAVRGLFVSYSDRRKATVALLEFVARFGANPAKATAMLDSQLLRYSGAEKMYLSGEYERARGELSDLIDEFPEIDLILVNLKDRALFWIYLVEWSSVSGASLVGGFVLWSLMVKRKLYRQVATTRAT
jgi:hypothetical protein